MKAFYRNLIFVLATFAILPFFAHAAPALDSIPDVVKSRYHFDGTIRAAVSDGSTLYIGGDFTTITLNPQGDPQQFDQAYLTSIDLSTYTLTNFNPQLNDVVRTLALSSDGSILYVGGSFTCVGEYADLDGCLGDTRSYVAAFNTATELVTSFDPEFDGVVYTLALSSDDTTLFAGGTFSTVNTLGDSPTRNNLAAVTTSDGIVTDFDPNLDGNVSSIVLSSDDSAVYATGGFTLVNSVVPQGYIAAFDSTTGNALPAFNPGLGGGGNALALSSDDGTLYVGGGGLASLHHASGEGASFDETTQESIEPFPTVFVSGGPGATIYTSIPDGLGGWYIGGSFTNVGTTTQARLAHITSSGILDFAFDPVIDNGTVYALALFGTTLYVGGSFNAVDSGTVRDYVAAFDTTNGSVTAFDPSAGATVNALALSSDGGTLYMGGEFGTFDGGATFRNYVGAFTTVGAGTVTAFDPDADSFVRTLALSDDGGTLYMGGEFTTFDATVTSRNYVGAFTTVGAGTVTAFNPNADNYVYSLAFGPTEDTIYAGGSFANIGGEVRSQFAELVTTTGAATALDAQVVSGGDTILAIALSSDENTIYLGGENFTQVGGEIRSVFAEIDATTGLATDFNPRFGDKVHTIAVSPLTQDVFVGGSFENYGLVSITDLIAIDLSDNSLISAFQPAFDAGVSALALSSDDTLLYVGGDFTDVNSGTSRDGLAALDVTDGSATAFDPVGTFSVASLALAADDSELYVGNYDGDTDYRLFMFDADGAGIETLTVSKDGTGSGTVTSDPAGVNCGVDCTEDYAADTEVTLTASATAGSDFIGWTGGGCAGTGVCIVTMSSAQSVTATFNLEDGDGDDDDSAGSNGGSSHRRPQDGINIFVVLMNRIRELLLQLIAQGGTVPPEMMKYLTPVTNTASFFRDLTLESQGPDVTKLQLFLITQNKGPQAKALAAIGATGFFGPLTQSALAEYQAAVGITPASGYFGPVTRALLNSF